MKPSLFKQWRVGVDGGSDSGLTNQAYAPALFGNAPRIARNSGRDQRRLEYANAVAPVSNMMVIVSSPPVRWLGQPWTSRLYQYSASSMPNRRSDRSMARTLTWGCAPLPNVPTPGP